jgi:hypothetical protein
VTALSAAVCTITFIWHRGADAMPLG